MTKENALKGYNSAEQIKRAGKFEFVMFKTKTCFTNVFAKKNTYMKLWLKNCEPLVLINFIFI